MKVTLEKIVITEDPEQQGEKFHMSGEEEGDKEDSLAGEEISYSDEEEETEDEEEENDTENNEDEEEVFG